MSVLAFFFLVSAPFHAQAQQELVRDGDAHFVAARYREALAAYEKARAQAPGDVGILMRAARSREAIWKSSPEAPESARLLETAAGEYREVLRADPDDQEALDGFVRASVSLGKRDEAYAFLKGRIAEKPTDARTIAWLSTVCARSGKVDEQESWLRRLVSLTPNDAEAYYTLGTLAWERSYGNPGGKMDAAQRRRVLEAGMTALDRAIALDPDYFEAMLYKNLLYREQAKVETDPSKRSAQVARADEWQKKAMEARQRAFSRPSSRPTTPLSVPPPPPPPPPKKPGAPGGSR